MRVNCNISALIANNQLGKSEDALSLSIERLSSGLKINHASDDASGMAISKKMHAQIKALERSSNNTQDGVSVVQTAESALSEVENMLQRMRELAVQAASDTNGDSDRDAIQAEIDELAKEIDRISTDTEYNTMPLLDGTLSRRAYSNVDGVSSFSVSETVKSGEYQFRVTQPATQARANLTGFGSAVEDGSITINGAKVDFKAGDSFATISSKIQAAAERGNATAEVQGNYINIANKAYGKYEELEIKFSSSRVANMFGSDSTTMNRTGSDCVAVLGDGFSSTATVSTEGKLIKISDVDSFKMEIEVEGDRTYNSCTMKVTNLGVLDIQSGANEGQQISIDIPEISVHTLGLDNLNVRTGKGASSGIEKIDSAIEKVSQTRSKLGAYQNRLETTTQSLEEYEENITAGLSRIEDCDMAEEMTEFTAQNVKTQAATSILAQANERPETILQLLQ